MSTTTTETPLGTLTTTIHKENPMSTTLTIDDATSVQHLPNGDLAATFEIDDNEIKVFLDQHAATVRDTAATTQERMGALLRLRNRGAQAAKAIGGSTSVVAHRSAAGLVRYINGAYEFFLRAGGKAAGKALASDLGKVIKGGGSWVGKSIGWGNIALLLIATPQGRRLVGKVTRPVRNVIGKVVRKVRPTVARVLRAVGLGKAVDKVKTWTTPKAKPVETEAQETTSLSHDIADLMLKRTANRLKNRAVVGIISKLSLKYGVPGWGLLAIAVYVFGVKGLVKTALWLPMTAYRLGREIVRLVARLVRKVTARKRAVDAFAVDAEGTAMFITVPDAA